MLSRMTSKVFSTILLITVIQINLLLAENMPQKLQAVTTINSIKNQEPKPEAQKPASKKAKDTDKPKIQFKNGDLKATFGSSMKAEYIFYKNMRLLNNKLPDEYSCFKQTIDLTLDVAYGKKRFGHKAVQVYTDLKCKTKWGVRGDYSSTAQTEVKIGNISLGFHEHRNIRPFPWFKDAWIQTSFNSALDLKTKNLHFIKAGWFPFQFGRGIALGSYYATATEHLGLYSFNLDSSAPGINFSGEIIKDKLLYDLYYSKFEDNSFSLRETLNNYKANQVGKINPWRGVAKDDELWGTRLRWKALSDTKKGNLDLEPYIYYNEASDQKAEVLYDSKTMLGAYGLAINYKKRVFEIGGEIAFNYGKEKLYSIDRNQIVVRKWDITDSSASVPFSRTDLQNSLYEANNYVVFSSNADASIQGKEAPSTSLVTSLAQKYQTYPANTPYPADANHAEYLQNKKGRIRPAYKNDLNGFMAVIDASYILEYCDLQFGTEYIFASGDFNPHMEERDKKYKGFVGLHEQYSGRKITSAIIAGEREISIPSSLPAGQKEVADKFRATVNSMLSDIHILGISAKWFPEVTKGKRVTLNPNLIFYWKDHESYKYVIDPTNINNNGTSDTEKARRFLGTELNIISSYNLLKDLYINAALSVFIPGGFYKDVKGVPLTPDYYLDIMKIKPDPKYIENYRMGTNNVYFADFSVSYRF